MQNCSVGRKYWISIEYYVFRFYICMTKPLHGLEFVIYPSETNSSRSHMRIQRGAGDPDPPPPLKNHNI